MKEYALGNGHTSLTYEPDSRWVLPECVVGIELEFEEFRDGPNPVDIRSYWNSTHDGSLRNNGIEFVSLPVLGKDLTAALDVAQKKVTGARRCVINYRTGLHIHMDVTDLSPEQLLSLLVCYVLFESALFAYCGNEREDNIYCVPYYKAPYSVSALGVLMNTIYHDADKIREVAESTEKYAALNLRPILTQGSIEFRHALGTTDMASVSQWIQMLMCLKKAALTNSARDLCHQAMQTGYRGLGESVFGHFFQYLPPISDVGDKFDRALCLAKETYQGLTSRRMWADRKMKAAVCSHPGFTKLVSQQYEYAKKTGEDHKFREFQAPPPFDPRVQYRIEDIEGEG